MSLETTPEIKGCVIFTDEQRKLFAGYLYEHHYKNDKNAFYPDEHHYHEIVSTFNQEGKQEIKIKEGEQDTVFLKIMEELNIPLDKISFYKELGGDKTEYPDPKKSNSPKM